MTWSGTLGGGEGSLTTGGDAARAIPVDWNARSEQAGETTSPEELLAAAEASCYAMTLALALTRNGTPADELEVDGRCTLDRVPGEAEYAITGLELTVRATGAGARRRRGGAGSPSTPSARCPVSNAVRDSVPVTLTINS